MKTPMVGMTHRERAREIVTEWGFKADVDFLDGLVSDIAAGLEAVEREVSSKPWLGNATSEELLDELRARLEVRGLLGYRTVDPPLLVDQPYPCTIADCDATRTHLHFDGGSGFPRVVAPGVKNLGGDGR